MIIGGEKPTLDELTHFGVKGMKWGQRKAEPMHSSYTPEMQRADRQEHGTRAVRRINAHLHTGGTRAEALDREENRDARQQMVVAAAVVVTGLLASHGDVPISSLTAHVVNKANANREAAKNAPVGISSTASKPVYIKPNRHGVHTITTMK